MSALLATIVLLAAQAPAPLSTTVGIKMGPYRPSIDAEPSLDGATPFKDIFADSQAIFFAPQVRVLWPVRYLNLGFAASVGWAQQSASALVDDGDDDTPATTGETSGGETSIRVNPFALLFVVRVNAISEWTEWPIVPYVEGGPILAYWRIGKGDGSAAASGTSLGYQINAGMAFRLDALDAGAAKSLEDQFRVRGTELTFEWSHSATRALRVGDSTWTAGFSIGF